MHALNAKLKKSVSQAPQNKKLPIIGSKDSGETGAGDKKSRSAKIDRPKKESKKETVQIPIHYRLYKPNK